MEYIRISIFLILLFLYIIVEINNKKTPTSKKYRISLIIISFLVLFLTIIESYIASIIWLAVFFMKEKEYRIFKKVEEIKKDIVEVLDKILEKNKNNKENRDKA